MERVKTIAEKRYGHALVFTEAFDLKFNKISMIRDLCQQVGLILREKDYEFPNVEVKKYGELPFAVEDVADIHPVIKFLEVIYFFIIIGL